MDNIKLIAIDIGGTLITDNNKLTDANLQVLKKVKEKNIKIALITARMYSSTKYISKVIDADYGVFGNGASIIDLKNEKSLYSIFIPKECLRDLIEFANTEGIYVHLNQLFVETSDKKEYFAKKHIILNEQYPEKLKSNIKIVDDLAKFSSNVDDAIKVVFVSNKNLDNFLQKLKNRFPYIFVTEYATNLYENAIDETINYIEIGLSYSNKADGLAQLLEILGLKNENVLVIGDGDNDIEMLKNYKNSGCTANGSIEAKKYAKYISNATNNDSGAAEIVKKFVKKL